MAIGTVVWAGYGPFYVADALDLYKDHGLKVNLQFFKGQECLANATQQCDGHDVQLLHSGKKARDRVVMTVSRAFIPPCSFLIPGSRKTLGPAS